jgi:glucosyl-3-phosphoglycerate synthase
VSRLTVLVAARDEEERIGRTVARLRAAFTEADVVVADDGSRDDTAAVARDAGAMVLRLPRRGKGQALTLAERECAPGPLVLCDADLEGDIGPLATQDADLAIAVFARRAGGGLGVAKDVARGLIELRGGRRMAEPLSGQRFLSERARACVFPVAAGFGVETRMTIDALRVGLDVAELELDLSHRATTRDLPGFLHRGLQLRDLVLATLVPQARNFRGLRLPLVGSVVGLAAPAVAPVAALGLADDLWSGPERGFRAHLRAGATTGTLKLVGIPLWALWRTRSLSAAVLVALCANLLNQLDTRPGRALKGFFLGSLLLRDVPRGALAVAVLLSPYDHREMAMLGDGGSNALGAVLGLRSVRRLTGARRIGAIGALAALTLLGERRSLGAAIESTPGIATLDALGRYP